LGLNANTLSDESTLRSLSDYVDKYLSQFTIDELKNDELGLYQSVLLEFERPILNYVMKRTNNNQIKASQILGLNRNTLRKKLRSLKMGVSKL
jgi:two-component system nitrogen regulation response regulator GlnG